MYVYLDLSQHEPNTGNTKGKTSWNKKKISGVRLSYNELTSLDGLGEMLSEVMHDPYNNLHFLDISHNRLTSIESELAKFVNLAVVYLHGNCLPNLRSVAVLNDCKNLKKVTLHGNPSYFLSLPSEDDEKAAAEPVKKNAPSLEADSWYRVGITWMLRDTLLHSIDFVPITPKDR